MWKALKILTRESRTGRPIYVLGRRGIESEQPAIATLGVQACVFLFHDWRRLFAKTELRRVPAVILIDLDHFQSTTAEKLPLLKKRFPSSALILICSNQNLAHARELLEQGVSDYVMKPVDPELIGWTVEHWSKAKSMDWVGPDKIDARIVSILAALSSASSEAELHHLTLQGLKDLLSAHEAVWMNGRKEILQLGADLPEDRDWPLFSPDETKNEGDLFLPIVHRKKEGVVVKGVSLSKVKDVFGVLNVLIEHSESCLMHLKRLARTTGQMFVDDLTGLFNARYLPFVLARAVSRCPRAGHFSVLFIDVDRFKSINDTYGHMVGSAFLVHIAKTIRSTIRRREEEIFRYGGDEFVVVLRNTTAAAARKIAERVRAKVEESPLEIENVKVGATVSIGIATYPDHARKENSLLKLADEAMYHAKRLSRNMIYLALGSKPKPMHTRLSAHKR